MTVMDAPSPWGRDCSAGDCLCSTVDVCVTAGACQYHREADMSATDTGQPYSAQALAAVTHVLADRVSCVDAREVLIVAHDRAALGLDASARIGDILDEVVAWLRLNQVTLPAALKGAPRIDATEVFLRELDAHGGQ